MDFVFLFPSCPNLQISGPSALSLKGGIFFCFQTKLLFGVLGNPHFEAATLTGLIAEGYPSQSVTGLSDLQNSHATILLVLIKD